MAKEYLGVSAIGDLFDIIDENYVSKADLEARNKEITSAINVGSALIATSILKLAEVTAAAKGGEGGVDERLIATDSEVEEVLSKYFNVDVNDPSIKFVDERNIATKNEVAEVLKKYFKIKGK